MIATLADANPSIARVPTEILTTAVGVVVTVTVHQRGVGGGIVHRRTNANPRCPVADRWTTMTMWVLVSDWSMIRTMPMAR